MKLLLITVRETTNGGVVYMLNGIVQGDWDQSSNFEQVQNLAENSLV